MGVYECPLTGVKPIQKTPLHSPVVRAIPAELRVPLDYEDRRASLGDFAFRMRFRVRLLLIDRFFKRFAGSNFKLQLAVRITLHHVKRRILNCHCYLFALV